MIYIYKNILLFEMILKEINFFYINCKKDKIKNEKIIQQWAKCCDNYGENINLIRRDAVHYLDYSVENFLLELDKILGNTPENWDILFFGILRMMAQKTENPIFHRMLNKKGYNNGLHCYMVNKQSTKKLLKLIAKVGAINQIDILLRDHANFFRFFIYKELLVKQDVDHLESTRLGRFVKDDLKKNFDEINLICEEEKLK
jgi:hypothetical protein